MVKKLAGILLLNLVILCGADAQVEPFKVYLVGDAGEVANNKTTMNNLAKELTANPRSAVIFLGDNSYKNMFGGLVHYGYRGFDSSLETQSNLLSQLDAARNYRGAIYFIPGNHDWWNLENFNEGRLKLKMEESFIEKNLANNKNIANSGNTFLPKNGNAGPDDVVLDEGRIRVIFMDTYRLIMMDFKKEKDYLEKEKIFYSRLEALLLDAKKQKQKIIIAAHHPIFYQGLDSSAVKNTFLFSRIKASSINFPSYKKMALKIREILKNFPGAYYVCGHLHGLQYCFPADSIHYIISGAGSKTLHISESEINRHDAGQNNGTSKWNTRGFFEVDFSAGSSEKLCLFFNEGTEKIAVKMNN